MESQCILLDRQISVGGLRMGKQPLAVHAISRYGIPDLDLILRGKAG